MDLTGSPDGRTGPNSEGQIIIPCGVETVNFTVIAAGGGTVAVGNDGGSGAQVSGVLTLPTTGCPAGGWALSGIAGAAGQAGGRGGVGYSAGGSSVRPGLPSGTAECDNEGWASAAAAALCCSTAFRSS